MENRDSQIIKKILMEIDVLEEMIKGFDLEKFVEDERTKRAVCMTLINIGELVKNLRIDGLGYKRISKQLEISIDSVKAL